MPRGGSREGAGRPPTYRRITLDAEAARQLAALLHKRRAEAKRSLDIHWTAAQLVNDLITAAWWSEIGQHEPPRS